MTVTSHLNMDDNRLPQPAAGVGKPAEAGNRAAPSVTATTAHSASQRRWRSAELFGMAQEVEIEHGQAVYRLRRTSLGKLILTK